MWAESVKRVGSTFHFTIQAPTAPHRNTPFYRMKPPNWPAGGCWSWTTTPLTGALLQLRAESWGMVCRTGRQPAEALAQLVDADPHLTWPSLDMQMPEMDGVDLAAALRQTAQRPQLPLVLLSSIGGLNAAAAGQSRGGGPGDAVQTLKPSRLYETLLAVLTVSRQW
jgi:CheY-like chemotaxis protein